MNPDEKKWKEKRAQLIFEGKCECPHCADRNGGDGHKHGCRLRKPAEMSFEE